MSLFRILCAFAISSVVALAAVALSAFFPVHAEGSLIYTRISGRTR
ncbi:MAG: hypothetical protein QFX33_02165 [Candidatus Nezhaarchaeota archaeon]|nr:hypothetical protein [Candidatus Nezhaarchaeota archaeon]